MVSPGATDTDLLRSTNSAEGLAMAARMSPLGRLGQPADVADVDAQRAVVGFTDGGSPPSGVAGPYFGGIQLNTPDAAGAAAFYGATVGWTLSGDRFLDADGVAVAGIGSSAAAAWLPHLVVTAVEPVAVRAAALGGAVEDGVLRDPQGAVLALRVAAPLG